MHWLIVEDVPIYRDLLAFACKEKLGQCVVATTGSGLEAIRLARDLAPEAAFVDLGLDDLDGLEVVEHVACDVPACRIYIISLFCTPYIYSRLMRAPIRGFIDKNTETFASLARAIEAAARGGSYYSQSYLDLVRDRRNGDERIENMLTKWEQLILKYVAQGADNEQIAEALRISERTVKGIEALSKGSLECEDRRD